MVIQEEPAVVPQQTQPPANIDNIMSGIENTGTVRMNNHRKKLRQRFDIIKKLGQGTYGKVQLGINKETGQEVAIKTIKKCKIETEADLIRIRREVQIMSSVQHPNIIHIYEVFENREKMVLVMEFAAGGELYDYLSERKVLSEEEARRVFRQISTAVYYCHKHKICHRDLKLENILLDEHGSAKIADFGLSNVFDEHRLLSTFCGSPLYASPEIVKGTPYQGPEADCWSLGVLLYTLVYGAMPFDGSNFKRLVKQISQGDYYEPRNASPASPLIREMLTVCPKQRANIETICSHWWVNEGYDESCLDLAEELANQTPVRLDVLLSLAPPAVTADQLVVPTPGVQESKSTDRVARSHSVGSVIDLTNTEAEQRIIDMVTQGGEAALMPSPTRIMTPAESPAQAKRKLEQTVSTENATGVIKKKEKASVDPLNMSKRSIPEQMEVELSQAPIPAPQQLADITQVENICDELIAGGGKPTPKKVVVKKKVPASTENKAPEPVKPAATETSKHDENIAAPIPEPKSSSPSKPSAADTRRKSRIFETAEKFQNMNNANTEKAKKFGATVGNFKKEFERKASMTGTNLPERIAAPIEKKTTMTTPLSPPQDYKSARKTSLDDSKYAGDENMVPTGPKALDKTIEQQNKLSDSKSSITSFSLEEARRSMENSIALLNQARNESNKELDQLCAKTENVSMSDIPMNTAVPGNNFIEREKKLKAREIIGNAIPTGRHCMGVRKPPVPFGINGRSISGSVIPSNTGYEKKPLRVQLGGPENMATAIYSVSTPENKMYPDPFADQRPLAVAKLIEKLPHELPETTKTSRAEITLKSATLPRRKPAKTDMKVDIEPKSERGMRFSTEMQHQIPDLRSAPIREHPYSPTTAQPRATSLEPKELIIPVQRPPAYQKASSTSVRSGTLSRQSTNESDTDTTIQSSSIGSMSTLGGATSSSQPIKKSPREFIIPIAVEGGGFLTPRAGSLEPSDSASTSATLKSAASNTAFGKLGRPRRIGSLLSDKDAEDDSPFQKLHRHTSISRDSDNEEPRFHTMHRLRSTRPMKRVVNADPNNDSASSGEDDDDDGFEILTAENLFSTLLSRVRDLTNRLNVNDTHGFPSSRLMSNFRQPHSSFWNHDPFNSNLNKSSSSWRHSISRDLGSDFDSMFSRSGATLPRGTKFKSNPNSNTPSSASSSEHNNTNTTTANSTNADNNTSEKLDLRDLDLSRLRLTKKDLETLSSITPNLPKQVQEQLIAQLPPNQARKLCRTLSMQNGTTELNSTTTTTQKPYKRSLSGGRDLSDSPSSYSNRSSGVFATAAATSDRNSTYRRSLSKTRYDNNEKTSRSSSRCRDSICDTDDSSNAYLNDLAKYRSFNRDYERSNSESTTHTSSDYYNNLPPVPGCISPPPLPGDITLRRRSAPKRISRFLRPDFYDTPREDSIYVSKDNKDRDSESRRILKEIRERSRERSADRNGTSSDRLNYIMEKYAKKGDDSSKYSRHSSVEGFTNDSRDSLVDYDKRRQSFSKSKDPSLSNIADKINFADKILNELQNIAKIQKEEVVATTAAAAGATTTTQKDENNEKIENVEDSTPDKKTDKKETKIIKVKKVKSRDKLADSLASNSPPAKVNDINMVTNLTKEIDSISPLNVATSKVKESKLMRPKSYPNKDKTTVKKSGDETGAVDDKKTATTDTSESTSTDGNKSTRPKSFPNSKLTPPKDVKKTDSPPNEKSSSVITKSKLADKEKSGEKQKTANGQTKTVKKVIKTVKKTIKNNSTAVPEVLEKTETTKEKIGNDIKEASPPKQLAKEVSPEKKVNKGFLYSIGQKFEKFRENTKTKEKKTAAATKDNVTKDNKDAAPIISTPINSTPIENSVDDLKKKKTKVATDETKSKKVTTAAITAPIIAADKKSKIDSMIRNLREKSVPRSPVMSESRLLKRATSVEDISGGYNKCGVNKVLGLFKKYEKDQQNTSKLKNTKSTSHVETDVDSDGTPTVTVTLPRPKSIVETNSSTAPRKNAYKGTQSDSILTISEQMAAKQQQQNSKIPKFGCNECNTYENESVTKRHSTAEAQNLCNEEKEMMKNKRKGLMLDFTKLDSPSPSQLQSQNHNGVLQSDTNSNNIPPLVNNNCIYPSSSHDINRNTNSNHSYESLTNYSSDLRSPYDDGASTSTVFSPNSEDHELMFDNWSVCSDDHTYPTPSPSTSHYSRSSHIIPSPLLENASSESIVDRIRRKSFYTRFNEKKPKRVSTIVGPGAKEYNPRESSVTRSASKPLEYKRSATSSTDHTKNTHEYYRPLKTNTFDNVYNLTTSSSALDSKPKSSYHLPPTTSSITKHHHHHPSFDHTDYKFLSSTTSPSEYISSGSYKKSSEHLFPPTTSKRTTMYDPQHLPLPPSTYNSRSTPTSSYLNGTTSSTNLETYATLGRKIRPYEQRSLSLMNSLNSTRSGIASSSNAGSKLGSSSSGLGIGNSSSTYNREQRVTPDYGSLSRSNIRTRTPSVSKGSTNA